MNDLMQIRRQATLFFSQVPASLSQCRLKYNPVQAALIPAHVTLCREDEVPDWDAFERRVATLMPFTLQLSFGRPVRNGHSVLLPATQGMEKFAALRHSLLFDGRSDIRSMGAHITIIHPRNGTCDDDAFSEIEQRLPPFNWTFNEISLIEQHNGGPWKTLSRHR